MHGTTDYQIQTQWFQRYNTIYSSSVSVHRPTTGIFVYFIHAREVDFLDLVMGNTFHTVHARFGILSSYLIVFLLQIFVVNSDHIHYHVLNIDPILFHIIYSCNFSVYGKFVVVRDVVTIVTTGNYVRAVHNDTSVLVQHSAFLGLYYCFLYVQAVSVHIR